MYGTRVKIYKKFPIRPLSRFLKFLEDGEIDYNLLKNILNTKFVGKEFISHTSVWDVLHTTIDLFKISKKYKDIKISYKSEAPQEGYIIYKNYILFTITVKKKQERYHHGYWSSYYDWSIKEILLTYFDIDKKMLEIDEKVAQDLIRENKLFQQKVLLYKKIKELYPSDDYYTIMHKLEALIKDIYKVDKYVKEEAK